MRLILHVLTVLFMVPQAAWSNPQCEQDYAIWVSETGNVRHIVYGSEGVRYYSDVYFEEWRESKLAWRARASVTCSNGAVTCYALVENASGSTGDDGITSIVIEQIDENADGLPEWVVFAALGQSLYYNGGAKVKWFNGFGQGQYDRVTMPNIYQFFDCREPGELKLYRPVGESADKFLESYLARFSDRRTKAFIKASLERTPRIKAVINGMDEYVSFEKMVRDGRISSPTDCLPEFRVLCFDVLKTPTGETVVQEWSEWVDGMSPEELVGYVNSLMMEAAERGFNLLTDAELAAVDQ